MTAVAAQHRVDMTQADLYTTEGYATFDLLADPQLTEELRLNVALYNLTNQAYIETCVGAQPPIRSYRITRARGLTRP
jgi:TonB dependent receptor.